MTGCPDENTIVRYACGQLGGDARASIAEHVDRCNDCTLMVAELARLDSVGVTARGGAPSKRQEPTPYRDVARPLVPGEHVGRYVVEGALGAGAMGAVYAARDPSLGRRVALKVVLARATQVEPPAVAQARLLREAQAMARLQHPNVVGVYETAVHEDAVFFAMEYVAGTTLRAWLDTHRPMRARLDALLAAGEGLAAAHDAGVLHRDFKPDNVLVGADGRVRVTDFGLAALGPPRALTMGGVIIGTPAYMAYEQLVGLPVDARADQFAFAVTACEALFGARPFAGTSVDELRLAMEGPPVIARAPDVPAAIARVLSRALARDPAQRWPSMHALLGELRGAAFGSAELHLRVHTMAQLAAGFVHLALCVVLVVRMATTPDEPSSSSGASDESGVAGIAAGFVIVLYLVALLGYMFLGVVWGPLNALGLSRRWAWARWSTMAYGAMAALSCCALPYGVYAIWAMTRPAVKDAFSRGPG